MIVSLDPRLGAYCLSEYALLQFLETRIKTRQVKLKEMELNKMRINENDTLLSVHQPIKINKIYFQIIREGDPWRSLWMKK
jgi:hypothetical protein